MTGRHGVGLRPAHYSELLAGPVGVTCAELVTENLLGRGGRPRAVAERVRREMPLYLHGLSLSIGGLEPLDEAYLRALRGLADDLEVEVVSDHLCFASVGGQRAHDLWPLPFTEEALRHVAARVRHVQDVLGRAIHLENVSSYVSFATSELSEWEFLAALVAGSGCRLLLDVNNVVVNAHNHGFAAAAFVEGIPRGSVGQLHLAGHTDHGTHRFDDHGSEVSDEVWSLHRHVVARFGSVPTIVEWDGDVPPLATVVAEAQRAAAEARAAEAA